MTTATFHETLDGRSEYVIGTVEVVLSHFEAFKALDKCTLLLLQGGNGLYVRESMDEVRAALKGGTP